jgi:hypothetical protein
LLRIEGDPVRLRHVAIENQYLKLTRKHGPGWACRGPPMVVSSMRAGGALGRQGRAEEQGGEKGSDHLQALV